MPITNSNPGAICPTTVTIPAGSTKKSFVIKTAISNGQQTGTIAATFGSTTFYQALTVRGVSIKTLTLTPNPVVGGTDVTGRITLDAIPPADVTVALTTHGSPIAEPATTSITIPAGTTTGTFTIHTVDVLATGKASVSATVGSASVSKILTVTQ